MTGSRKHKRSGVKSRSHKKQKGGALIKGHLVSKVSHKAPTDKTAHDAAKSTWLDLPRNPVPVQKKGQSKGVLSSELTTNLHLSR